jgi:hypothetical protein
MLVGIFVPVLHLLNSPDDCLLISSFGYPLMNLVLHRFGGQSFHLRLLDHILDVPGILLPELMLVHCLQIGRIILVYLILCPVPRLQNSSHLIRGGFTLLCNRKKWGNQ